jgi:signal recognition particle GTPase
LIDQRDRDAGYYQRQQHQKLHLLSVKLVRHAAFSQVTKNRAAPNSAMHTSISRAEPKKAARRNRLRLKTSLIGFVLLRTASLLR